MKTTSVLTLLILLVTSANARKNLRQRSDTTANADRSMQETNPSPTASSTPSSAPSDAPSDYQLGDIVVEFEDFIAPENREPEEIIQEAVQNVPSGSTTPSSAPSDYQLGDLVVEFGDFIAPDHRESEDRQGAAILDAANDVPSSAPSDAPSDYVLPDDPIVHFGDWIASLFP